MDSKSESHTRFRFRYLNESESDSDSNLHDSDSKSDSTTHESESGIKSGFGFRFVLWFRLRIRNRPRSAPHPLLLVVQWPRLQGIQQWINSRNLRTHSCLLSSDPAYKEYNNGSTPAVSAPTPACCPATLPTRNTTMDQLPQSPHPLLLVVQWPRLQGIQQWINSRSLRTHSCLLSSDPAYKEYNNGSTPAVSAPTPACCPVTPPTRNTTMDQLPQSPHPLLLVVQRPCLQGIQQWINSRSLRTHSCLLSSDPAYKEYNNGSTPAVSAPTPACCPVTLPTRNTTMDQLPQSPHPLLLVVQWPRLQGIQQWINSRSLRTHSCLLSSDPAYKEYNNGSTHAVSAPTPACCPVTLPTRNTTMDQLPQSPHPLLLVVQWHRLQGIHQWINSRSLRTHSCLLSSDPAYKEYNNGSTPAISAPTPACCPVTLPTRNTTMDQLPQSPHPLLLVVQWPCLQGIQQWINSRNLRTHSCLLSSDPAYKEYNNGSTPAVSTPTPACCPATPPTRNTTMDQLPQSPHPLLLVVQRPRLQGIQQWINSRNLRTHSCLLSSDPAYKV